LPDLAELKARQPAQVAAAEQSTHVQLRAQEP
jgi:hypothetical protein